MLRENRVPEGKGHSLNSAHLPPHPPPHPQPLAHWQDVKGEENDQCHQRLWSLTQVCGLRKDRVKEVKVIRLNLLLPQTHIHTHNHWELNRIAHCLSILSLLHLQQGILFPRRTR